MWENCDVISNFPIYGQFGAIRKRDFRRMVCETYVFISYVKHVFSLISLIFVSDIQDYFEYIIILKTSKSD